MTAIMLRLFEVHGSLAVRCSTSTNGLVVLAWLWFWFGGA